MAFEHLPEQHRAVAAVARAVAEGRADRGIILCGSGVGAAVREALEERGHRLSARGSFGGYQAVARDPSTGLLSGASESRKDGCASGY